MNAAAFTTSHDAIVGMIRDGRLAEAASGLERLSVAVEPDSLELARVRILSSAITRARVGRNLHGDPGSLAELVDADLRGAFEILERHRDDASAMVLAGRVAIQLAESAGRRGEALDSARWYRDAARCGEAAGPDRFAGTQDLYGASASFSMAAGALEDALEPLGASSKGFEPPAADDRLLAPTQGEPEALAGSVERAIGAAVQRGTVRLAFDLAKALLGARARAGGGAGDLDPVVRIISRLVESGRDDEYAIQATRLELRAGYGSPGALAVLGLAAGRAADRLGRYPRAGELFRQALERLSGHPELDETPLVLALRYEAAENARVVGAHDEALAGFAGLADTCDRLGQSDAQAARVFNNFADALAGADRYDEAERWARKALEIRDALFEEPHHDLGRSHATLANILYALGQREAASAHAARAAASYARVRVATAHGTQAPFTCRGSRPRFPTASRCFARLRQSSKACRAGRRRGWPTPTRTSRPWS